MRFASSQLPTAVTPTPKMFTTPLEFTEVLRIVRSLTKKKGYPPDRNDRRRRTYCSSPGVLLRLRRRRTADSRHFPAPKTKIGKARKNILGTFICGANILRKRLTPLPTSLCCNNEPPFDSKCLVSVFHHLKKEASVQKKKDVRKAVGVGPSSPATRRIG